LPRRPDSIPRNILNKKEISTLLSAPNLETPLGIRDRAIFELLYSSGIRAGELRNLTLDDLDINHGELRINRGKGAKDRIVPLGEVASDYLEFYLKEARPKLAPSAQTALFVTKSGRKLGKTDLSDLTERYRARAGMKKYFTPHSLRHTCATHLLKGKADIRQIQEILGHASIANTQIYTRVEVTDLKKVLKNCHPRERREIEAREL
jgi:integrase/recombinase XerD